MLTDHPCFADDSWPDLLQVLFTLSQAPDAGKRETAFRVFTTTPGIIQKQHEDAVAQAFAQAFKDESVAVCSLAPWPST
jgi:hypothetical protein